MKIRYQLTISDFLAYQLYTSSKSDLLRKRRTRHRLLIPILYLGLGIYFYVKLQKLNIALIFGMIAILWFSFYPKYTNWRHKKLLKQHITENYKNRIDKPVELDFNPSAVKTKDFATESRISSTEFKQLIETQDYFFIKLVTDLSIVIPKRSINDEMELKKQLSEYGAEHVDELDWRWK